MGKSLGISQTAWIPCGFSATQRHRLLLGCQKIHCTNATRRCSVCCVVKRNENQPSKDSYNQFAELLNKIPSFSDDQSQSTAEVSKEESSEDLLLDRRGSSSEGYRSSGSQSSSDGDETVKRLYNQFADKLGTEDPDIESKGTEEKLKEQYTWFADQLDIDEKDTPINPSSPPKPVPRSTPKSSDIDPADYSTFEALLNRTGGGGRKVVKGSRRWATSNSSSASTDKPSAIVSHPASLPSDPTKDTPVRFSPSSEVDKSKGYATLAQQFGTGFHDTIDRSVPKPNSPMADIKSKNDKLPTLLKPPSRPGDLSSSKERPQVPQHTFDEDDVYVPPAEVEPTPILQPKPQMPSHSEFSDGEAPGKHVFENNIEHKDDQNGSNVLTPNEDSASDLTPAKTSSESLAALNEKPVRPTPSVPSAFTKTPKIPESEQDSPSFNDRDNSDIVQRSEVDSDETANDSVRFEDAQRALQLNEKPIRRVQERPHWRDRTKLPDKRERFRGNRFGGDTQEIFALRDPKIIISE